MVRVYVLRGVIASGDRLVAETIADVSESDAQILVRSGKVRVLPPDPPIDITPPIDAEPEQATAPVRQTATRSRRRKATL